MSMDRRERSSALAAQLFELLDDPERARVEQWMAKDPSATAELSALRRAVREAAGRDGMHPTEADIRAAVAGKRATPAAQHTLEHLIGCRECGFLASLALAEQENDDIRPELLGETQPARRRRWSPLSAGRAWVPAAVLSGVALAAVTLRLVLADRAPDGRDRAAGRVPGALQNGSAPTLWSRPVRLGTTRGSGAPPKVLLHELTEPNLTLLFRVPAVVQGTRWQLSAEGATVLAGLLPAGHATGAGVEFALTVPVERLPGKGLYLLQVTDPAGRTVGEWTFALAVE